MIVFVVRLLTRLRAVQLRVGFGLRRKGCLTFGVGALFDRWNSPSAMRVIMLQRHLSVARLLAGERAGLRRHPPSDNRAAAYLTNRHRAAPFAPEPLEFQGTA